MRLFELLNELKIQPHTDYESIIDKVDAVATRLMSQVEYFSGEVEVDVENDNYLNIVIDTWCYANDVEKHNKALNKFRRLFGNYLKNHGWQIAKFATSARDYLEDDDMYEWVTFVGILPFHGTTAEPSGEYLYHVTHQDNVEDIMKNGLRPNHGSDFMRFKNKRLYLCDSGECVDAVALDMVQNRNISLDELYVIRFKPSQTHLKFFDDTEWDIDAIWTPYKIPAKYLEYKPFDSEIWD